MGFTVGSMMSECMLEIKGGAREGWRKVGGCREGEGIDGSARVCVRDGGRWWWMRGNERARGRGGRAE